MALTATTDGPYFTSGSISFSQLRSTFKQTSSGAINFSEYRRDTNTSNTNPIVPDATENSEISATTNLRMSQFRNSIKYYYVNQGAGDNDSNLDLTDSWNGNLGKNIVKTLTLAGTSGSTNGNPAASLDANAVYNLLLIITGSILGSGGTGGTSGKDGTPGGNALYINVNAGQVTVRTSGASAQVYGGGGGGGGGGPGGNGGAGSITTTGTDYWANTGCVGNSMPCQYSPNFNSPIPCDREACNNIRSCGDGENYTLWERECWHDWSVTVNYAGGIGGDGGDGGDGQGYGQERTRGEEGLEGTLPEFDANGNTAGGQGGHGDWGGWGGDWGEAGENGYALRDGTTGIDGTDTDGEEGGEAGKGGAAGRAVAGSGYTIDQSGVDSAYRGAK